MAARLDNQHVSLISYLLAFRLVIEQLQIGVITFTYMKYFIRIFFITMLGTLCSCIFSTLLLILILINTNYQNIMFCKQSFLCLCFLTGLKLAFCVSWNFSNLLNDSDGQSCNRSWYFSHSSLYNEILRSLAQHMHSLIMSIHRIFKFRTLVLRIHLFFSFNLLLSMMHFLLSLHSNLALFSKLCSING